MEWRWQKKILVNWKNYPIESSNLKNRERVDRKKTEQNPRDHRDLGNNSKSNIHMIRVPEKRQVSLKINCVILA